MAKVILEENTNKICQKCHVNFKRQFKVVFLKMKMLFSSQAITYGICLNELGERLVHKYEGREHSGRKFNEIALDYQSKISILKFNICEQKGFIEIQNSSEWTRKFSYRQFSSAYLFFYWQTQFFSVYVFVRARQIVELQKIGHTNSEK